MSELGWKELSPVQIGWALQTHELNKYLLFYVTDSDDCLLCSVIVAIDNRRSFKKKNLTKQKLKFLWGWPCMQLKKASLRRSGQTKNWPMRCKQKCCTVFLASSLKRKQWFFSSPSSFLLSRLWIQWLELEQPLWTLRQHAISLVEQQLGRNLGLWWLYRVTLSTMDCLPEDFSYGRDKWTSILLKQLLFFFSVIATRANRN